ncbi:hypothetical protein IQ07DRAFT_155548 [Pyrenochaeta sp. DS3sAY3a]|nr:hypothetical protein IQ07DRAFT_155548 [Pyrenochaeta sp. DS3sAY3a]
MSVSTMRTAVLQATAIFTFSSMLSHHVSEHMFAELLNNEGLLNMTTALNISISNFAPNATTNLNTSAPRNTTQSFDNPISNLNQTELKELLEPIKRKSFYGNILPIDVITFLIVSVLQYWWFIWFEKLLPARRKRQIVNVQDEKVEESEDREEEVVKKWIAQGRVQRASLNWCNTFLKWVLELTVGNFWYGTVEYIVSKLLRLTHPKKVLDGLGKHLSFHFVGTFLSITPLANLIVFAAVPAHKQIVFVAGAHLVASIFLTTVCRALAMWTIKTDYVQGMMRNITDSVSEMSRLKNETAVPRIGDEL